MNTDNGRLVTAIGMYVLAGWEIFKQICYENVSRASINILMPTHNVAIPVSRNCSISNSFNTTNKRRLHHDPTTQDFGTHSTTGNRTKLWNENEKSLHTYTH